MISDILFYSILLAVRLLLFFFFFQAEDGIRDFCLSRGLGDVYKRQGEYKEVDSYDATRCYQVVDNNSKTTFDVTFYLYGDVVSGWDVTVADKDSSKK